MRTLARWFDGLEPERPLCRRGSETLDARRFADDAARLLDTLGSRARGRYLVCTESAYAAAVALFALWQHGSIAVLPPNLEPGTLAELARGAAGRLVEPAGTATDVGSGTSPALAILATGPARTRTWRALDPEAVVVELCTSGSSGGRKNVTKRLVQLEAEIEVLEREFGGPLGGARAPGTAPARILGTVSFLHVYGLLFRVLWPLCAGRVFDDATAVDPALIERGFAGAEPGVLVGSPAHLKRLPEFFDLGKLAPACVEVFSSGGPLDEATAARFEKELGFAPREVLGSTETGGIAWRRQGSRGDAAWRPFPGVAVESREGMLVVRSRPAGAPEGVGDGLATGDAVELLADGRFLLCGRADRIVKLFDERVSLSELEARLAAHAHVAAAGAVVIARAGTPRVAAAVVLRPAGAARLAEIGKAALVRELRSHLENFFRATALPRAWRFVERLPEDAQGKVTVAALEALFADESAATGEATPSPCASGVPAGPAPQATLVQRVEESESALEIVLDVPADLWVMHGHFEGFPVVPGVVQLQWVLDWAGAWRGARFGVRGLEALKFKQLLTGGARFRLRLERTSDDAKLRFRLWNELGEFSSGRVIVAAARA